MAPAELAVVGGGAAGLFVIREALRRRPDLSVCWYAPEPHPGLAWATRCPAHLLNVPVERMGARDPGDFLRWLRGQPDVDVTEGQFLPRARYADYLRALTAALPDSVRRVAARVDGLQRVDDGWQLSSAAGPQQARRVVLALGLPRPLSPAALRDAWDWWMADADLDPAARVLLAGSGLTAVDLVLGLRQRGHHGPITVVSPGGRWPEAHASAPPLPEARATALVDTLQGATSARAVVAALRAAARDWPWRAVVDALRGPCNALWAHWPVTLRARLLRHAIGTWNRHRHRMPPEVAAQLAADPALQLLPGRVHVDDGGLWRVHRQQRSALSVDLALDCRGPPLPALLSRQPWLRGLIEAGELQPYPLGTGLAPSTRPDLALIGAAHFGAAIETTAIPELRAQAQALAQRWFGA